MLLKQCCCMFNLRTSTFVIGYFYTISGWLISIAAIVGIVLLGNTKLEKTYEDGGTKMTKVCIAVGVFMVVQTTVSVSLVYGTYKKKVEFMVPWMIYAGVGFIASQLSIVFCILDRTPGDNMVFFTVTFQLTLAALFAYFLLVVMSYTQSLREDKEDKETDSVLLVQPDADSTA